MNTSSTRLDWKIVSRPIAILLLLFVCSVFIRAPKLNGYLGWHHQWLSAHTILTLSIWNENGIAHHKFNPIYTYNNPKDKHIQSLTSGIPDEKGDYYYVSYPPFSFLLAYFSLSLLRAPINPYSIYALNLFIHLISATLLYLLVQALLNKRPFDKLIDAGTFAFAFYLFLPLPAWYHGHIYFADILMQPLWFACSLLAVHLFWKEKIDDRRFLAGFGVINFLSLYTEWLSVFIAFTIFILALGRSFKDRRYIKLVAILVGTSIASLGLTLFQFSSINGFDAFINASIEKYTSRGGVPSGQAYFFWVDIYITGRLFLRQNLPLIALTSFLFLGNLIIRKKRVRKRNLGFYAAATFLICFPVLLHHIVFLEFTHIHDFALLKTSTCLIVFTAALQHKLMTKFEPGARSTFSIILVGVTIILLASSVYVYFYTNTGVNSPVFRDIAEEINDTASSEDVLFITGERQTFEKVTLLDEQATSAVAPQLMLATGRNIMAVPDSMDMINHMRKYNHKEAMLYTIDRNAKITNSQKIVLPE